MSDHRERACTECGSFLHHEDDCSDWADKRAEGLVDNPGYFGRHIAEALREAHRDGQRAMRKRAACAMIDTKETHYRILALEVSE